MKASLVLLAATCASSALATSLSGISPDIDERDVVPGEFKRTGAYPVEAQVYPRRDIEEDDDINIPDAGQGKGKSDGKGKDNGKGKGDGKGRGHGKGKGDGKGKGKRKGKWKGRG